MMTSLLLTMMTSISEEGGRGGVRQKCPTHPTLLLGAYVAPVVKCLHLKMRHCWQICRHEVEQRMHRLFTNAANAHSRPTQFYIPSNIRPEIQKNTPPCQMLQFLAGHLPVLLHAICCRPQSSAAHGHLVSHVVHLLL